VKTIYQAREKYLQTSVSGRPWEAGRLVARAASALMMAAPLSMRDVNTARTFVRVGPVHADYRSADGKTAMT
jgi:hypothetical protein